MRRVLLLTLAGLALASTALADITDVRFALHRKDNYLGDPPQLCDNAGTPAVEPNYSPNFDNLPCSNYVVTGPAGVGSQIYLVVARDTSGVSGVSFGIDYDGRRGPGPANGIDPQFTAWTSCTDGLAFVNAGAFGDFPNPKGGIRLTWSTCTTQEVGSQVHAVAGTFYIYAYAEDVFRVTPNNNLVSGPELAVTDCANNPVQLVEILTPTQVNAILGRVHIGGNGSQGYTPCGVVDSRPSTWGKIKTLYNK